MQKGVLFHFGCIIVRSSFIVGYYFFKSVEISCLGYLIGVLFLYKAKYGGSIGVFGSNVYWPRLLHSFTYILSGILMSIKTLQSYAFIPLLLDVVIGVCVFWYHYKITLPRKQRIDENINVLLNDF